MKTMYKSFPKLLYITHKPCNQAYSGVDIACSIPNLMQRAHLPMDILLIDEISDKAHAQGILYVQGQDPISFGQNPEFILEPLVDAQHYDILHILDYGDKVLPIVDYLKRTKANLRVIYSHKEDAQVKNAQSELKQMFPLVDCIHTDSKHELEQLVDKYSLDLSNKSTIVVPSFFVEALESPIMPQAKGKSQTNTELSIACVCDSVEHSTTLMEVFTSLLRSNENVKLFYISNHPSLLSDLAKSFEGRVSFESIQEDLSPKLLKNLDVLVYVKNDTDIRSLLTAMQCEVAIVALRHPFLEEFLVHKISAVFMDKASVDAMVASVTEVVDDISLRSELIKTAYTIANEKFNVDTVSLAYTQFYHQVFEGDYTDESLPLDTQSPDYD